MHSSRLMRTLRSLATGAFLLQAGGCDLTGANETLQTIFLGISAAASFVILQSGSFDIGGIL